MTTFGVALYSRLQGVLFSGGGDVHIKYFDGEDHPQISEVDDLRDTTELSMLRSAVEDGKPILAICRGVQVMNVATGRHAVHAHPRSIRHDHRTQPGRIYHAHSPGQH